MSSPRSQQLKQIPDVLLTESQILAKKLPLTTWNNLNPGPTIENHKKYHDKLMKPLQVNHRRKLLTLASNKTHQKWVDEPLPEMGYEELLSKVSEIKKISKLQEKVLGIQDPAKVRSRTPKESAMKVNLTEDAIKCIEFARESAIMQTESNLSRLQASSVENRVNNNSSNVENIGKHENKQKRLATQLSNQLDKKVPKQLNSNAHFRHTKRKILLLRALDSVVNQKEVVKEHYSSVKSCREINELANVSKESGVECYVSPSLNTIRPSSSKGREGSDTPASKFVGENGQQQQFYLLGGNGEGEQGSSIDATISRLFSRVPMSENFISSTPKAKSKTVLIAHKKSPVGSISHFLKDNEYFNNSQDIEKSQIQGNQTEKEEKIMRIPTIDSMVLDFNRSQYIPSKSQFYSSEDETCQKTLTGFSGRNKNKMKDRLMTEIKEKKDNMFKNELKLVMRNEPVVMLGHTSYALRPSKSVNSLKHIRRISQSIERRTKKKDSYWGTPVQSRTPREKSENAKESTETRRTVQELINKGFREESVEKEPGKREAETILNSYGFKDVDESLRKSRMKPRFSTLEGYQGEFLKQALAKTQRYMDNVMRKEKKLEKIL